MHATVAIGDTGRMASSQVLHVVVIAVAWLLAVVWLSRSLEALRGVRSMLDLTELDRRSLPELSQDPRPHLTVLVPARDEAASIEATLRSLLAQSGIRLQIVAIDDRSTDGTGATMDALVAEAARSPHELEVLHIHELPVGWLGKPHALARGIERARSPWLLFTDGDVVFAPEALHLALRTATRERADHFMLAPTLLTDTLGESAVVANLQILGNFVARMWRIGDPKAKDAFGVGGFSMVRAEALAAIGGMERLRMEVVEDVALGWLIKREMRRHSLMVLGPDLVRLRWVQGTFGLVRLLEKNGFAGMRYRVLLMLGACLSLLLHALVPLAALASGSWGIAAAVLTYLGIAIALQANRKLNGRSPWLALFFVPCVLILIWAFVRSTILTFVRGGVIWRGTLYPLDELKKHMAPFRMV
jgi:glycosyltransferase involved in cell wall biosynthesis